ncbi:M28 family peptidase [Terriglobus aquaticus]|uniref:M28 family peptidase n=1 Tax=Terriglobus aquaticus TaxID=940139 RepID=A0ABW9KID0_9BACT|nr:M28 family peptidase [Terriglobus aquaticus]
MKLILPRLFACVLSASLALPTYAELPLVPERTDWSTPAAAWWSHVQYLADDKLEGRRAGTPGYDKAVAYVEEQFRQIGLVPAGVNGYRQPVSLTPYQVDGEKSSARLETSAGAQTFTVGKELQVSQDSKSEVSAPLVFVGYGLRIPRKHVDDYTGVDLKGKIAVFFNAPPERLQGPQRAYARGADQRWRELRATGAIGMLSLALPRYIPGQEKMTPDQIAKAQPQSAGGQRVTFTDAETFGLPGLQFSGSIADAKAAEKLFAGTGHTYAELLDLAKAGKPLPSFPIAGTFAAHTLVQRSTPVNAPNVVGMLPGSDSRLKNEYVVVSAHLDHLGIGREIDGDKLYNGAMDNASGIASLIECAKLLAAQPHPKRSVIFIALVGEELGELGSQYFATKPTVPKQQIVADLNMDMYLPLFPLRFLEVQGLGESTLGNDARAVCQLNDVEVQFDKQPDENRFVRSDQVNFVKQGIPALAFKFGWTPDSPEEKTFNDWVKTRYHKPSDDLNQPVDKVAAAQFTLVLAQLTTRVANEQPRPSWYPESSFSNTVAAR